MYRFRQGAAGGLSLDVWSRARKIRISAADRCGRAQFEALREAIDAVGPEPSRPAAAIGAWALVHGLSHLIADNQLPMDLAGEDKRDALIENVLAIYRLGLAREAEPH
jgi:Tetracyclin repressor-like, C-terminal domain